MRMWMLDHQDVAPKHPFSELVPKVAAAVEDGVLDEEERADITWLCQKLCSTEFYDQVTADLQQLHAVVGGIAADGRITVEEMRGLSDWLRRSHFEQTVAQLGGRTLAAVSPNLNFLVIGAEGNPCWTYACYGRKVEKAVELRKKVANIVILHENDFHDAVLDA